MIDRMAAEYKNSQQRRASERSMSPYNFTSECDCTATTTVYYYYLLLQHIKELVEKTVCFRVP